MKPKGLQRNDLELLGLVALLLLAMGGYLVQQLGVSRQEGAGWRRIDTQAVQRLIEAGDLSDQEALWYHPGMGGKQPGKSRP